MHCLNPELYFQTNTKSSPLQTVDIQNENSEEKKENGIGLDDKKEEQEFGAEITKGPMDMTALQGQSATFTGKPKPIVSWLKKVRLIVNYIYILYFQGSNEVNALLILK